MRIIITIIDQYSSEIDFPWNKWVGFYSNRAREMFRRLIRVAERIKKVNGFYPVTSTGKKVL